MNRESQARFVAILLFLLTVAAVVFAGFNFQKERQSAVPDDGVWWVEHGGRLIADRVDPRGQGASAGIKPKDELISINGQEIKNTPGLERQLYATGVWHKASYSLLRNSVALDSNVLLIPADRSLNLSLRLIALIYLGIGVYVLLRRWTAPGSTHFYIFCLVSFHRVLVQLHGKAERLRLDHLLEQHCRLGDAAGAVPAFRSDLSRKASVRSQAAMDCWRWPTCRAAILLGRHIIALETGAGDGLAALGYGPAGNGIRCRAVRHSRGRSVVQLSARQHDDSCASN